VAQLVRYRLLYLMPSEGTRYESASSEFRTLRGLIVFIKKIQEDGGSVRSVEKWEQTEWTPQELRMVRSLLGVELPGRIKT